MYYFTFDQRNTVSKVGEMIETDRNNYIELLGTIQRSFWAAPCDNSCIKFQGSWRGLFDTALCDKVCQ